MYCCIWLRWICTTTYTYIGTSIHRCICLQLQIVPKYQSKQYTVRCNWCAVICKSIIKLVKSLIIYDCMQLVPMKTGWKLKVPNPYESVRVVVEGMLERSVYKAGYALTSCYILQYCAICDNFILKTEISHVPITERNNFICQPLWLKKNEAETRQILRDVNKPFAARSPLQP